MQDGFPPRYAAIKVQYHTTRAASGRRSLKRAVRSDEYDSPSSVLHLSYRRVGSSVPLNAKITSVSMCVTGELPFSGHQPA
jgi:hypothetical protein